MRDLARAIQRYADRDGRQFANFERCKRHARGNRPGYQAGLVAYDDRKGASNLVVSGQENRRLAN